MAVVARNTLAGGPSHKQVHLACSARGEGGLHSRSIKFACTCTWSCLLPPEEKTPPQETPAGDPR
jgi:hypothetical protein